jgi:HEPN domain-containing protein
MERYESWIGRTKSSYELSKARITNAIDFEDLCYQAQQAVEKSLKGFLIYFDIEPEFTHNISKLLIELEKHVEIPDNIKETIKLTNYAVQTRYPGDYNEITKEEYENSLKITKNCLDWVENKIKEIENNKRN